MAALHESGVSMDGVWYSGPTLQLVDSATSAAQARRADDLEFTEFFTG